MNHLMSRGLAVWFLLLLLCAIAMSPLSPRAASSLGDREPARSTRVTIEHGQWRINGKVTYPGARAEGLLMNVRMVNATFEDEKRPDFDAAANTVEFIEQIPSAKAHGVLAFTLCLQGGMPGYEGAVNSAFQPDGSLNRQYMARVAAVIENCDREGMAVILGCFYQRQCAILKDDDAIRAGVVNVARWIKESGCRNVLLEIANEYPHKGFAVRPLLQSPEGEAELIRLAKKTNPDLLVSASGYGDGKLDPAVAEASDFLLIHFNGVKNDKIPACVAPLRKYQKPIVCNEDVELGAEGAQAAEVCVAQGISWGCMNQPLNQDWPFVFKGAADDLQVYAMLKSLSSGQIEQAGELARVGVYDVAEIEFHGPCQGPRDTPARDIELRARFRHESGSPEISVYGFWDGDGQGGLDGDVFKVRFTPTKPGRWTLEAVESNAQELAGQKRGSHVTAVDSSRHGFWLADDDSPGRRWYRRSDGSHQYIVGNTQYSFLSGIKSGNAQSKDERSTAETDNAPSYVDIAADVRRNAEYFRKLRFSPFPDRYPNPTEKPFLDDKGKPTDNGDYAHRPNPRWFQQRADVAVATAFACDLIADLILAGPDTEDSRATLRAGRNKGDATPWLRYIAARYGSYPNVWICLANEYNIKKPKFTEALVAKFGQAIRSFLPYPTPLSVHASPPVVWAEAFDQLPPWNDHQIVQKKIKKIGPAADVIQEAWGAKLDTPRNKPTIDDELSYQGAGDKHNEDDTIEAHLGAFLGGGYGSTGYKPGNKLGHYFYGGFTPSEHTAADNLKWMRRAIDASITFWRMTPGAEIFSNLDGGFRAMSWAGREYVLGTDLARQGIVAQLPAGVWTVTRYNVIAKQATLLSGNASGRFVFDSPESRAVLFHFKRQP